jgi:hypothetical protein
MHNAAVRGNPSNDSNVPAVAASLWRRGKMKLHTSIVIVFAVLATISACSSTSEPPDADPVWIEPPFYTYVVESSCGERFFLGTFRIGVEHGNVVHVEALDESAEILVESSGNDAIPTLGELVAEYAAAKQPGPYIAGEADFARLVRSLDGSYPSSIEIDYSAEAMGDEACYLITEFLRFGLD